ncbi:MAG: alkaline phosphatase family protein [Desulfurococcales archaeon]|nr:alkaline phosphatase family protein [Desulfurococcales archaeon]
METVAVLGLDALPFRVLDKFSEDGIAQNIFGEKEKRRAVKLTAIPPITPASWPSIMSGVNPGKHGLFSFFHYDRRTHEQKLVTAYELEHPRIHEMLSFEGVESFVLNPIPDYPLLPSRRARIIANLFFTPDPRSHPAGLHERYFDGMRWPPKRNPGYYKEYLSHVLGLVEDLAREKPPLAWINVNFPDAIYHKFPETIDKPSKVRKLWDIVDKIASTLRQEFDHVLVVSDHGFRIFKYRVNVNDILERHGYVVRAGEETERVVEEELVKAKKSGTSRINVPTWFYKLVGRLGLEPFARKVFYNYIRPLYSKLTGKTLVVRSGASIDLHASKAYMPYGGAYGVYLKPGVNIDEVMSVLKKYRGLLVWRREEVYSGPHVGRGPDIVLVGDHENGYVLGPARLIGEVYTRTDYPGHDMWGVVIPVSGFDNINWDIVRDQGIPNSLVTPLIQCTLGLPVSHMVDHMGKLTDLCGGAAVRRKNYLGKFLISKKIALRRTSFK